MRFKPRLRDTVAANVAALKAMGGDASLPADLQRTLDAMPLPKRRKPPLSQSSVDIDPVHKDRVPIATKKIERYLEKDVLRAVGQLLAVHPRVKFALRVNSGMASYEQKSGKWAPVWFHEWVRAPEKCRMSDFLGATTDNRILAIECKRPGFTKPTDQREWEQLAFLQIVNSVGGIALFATSAAQVEEALR